MNPENIYFYCIDDTKAFDCVDHNKLWKTLQEKEIPVYLMCLLRNLYAGQEATVSTRHGTKDWFQTGKRVRQGYILSPYLFNLHAKYLMQNPGLDEAQTGIKTAGRNTNRGSVTWLWSVEVMWWWKLVREMCHEDSTSYYLLWRWRKRVINQKHHVSSRSWKGLLWWLRP